MRTKLLRTLIEDELHHAEDMQRTLFRLEELWPEMRSWWYFFRLKDERQRALSFLRQERLWYQGFSWWMARMLMLFGLFALIPAWFHRHLAERIIDFLFGAILLYIWIWVGSLWRYRRRRGREQHVETQYREKLTALARQL